jgi:hypothetical protein
VTEERADGQRAITPGLARHDATVILVGAAIGLVHWDKGRVSVAFLVGTMAAAIGGWGAIVSGIALRRPARGARTRRGWTALGVLYIVGGVLLVLIALLLWTGVAAGVK